MMSAMFLFLRDKLCRKVAHAHMHNHSNSNLNMCTCATLQLSLSRKYSNQIFPRAACPVQIGAHRHIDVYSDINKV